MCGPFANEYCRATCTDIETLEKMVAWEVIDRTDDMNVIDSTWTFKLKRFPDSLIKIQDSLLCSWISTVGRCLFIQHLFPGC